MVNLNIPSNVTNQELIRWVTEMAELCKPNDVVWCDGSQAEYDRLCEEMVASGTFIRLNEAKRPNSFGVFAYHRETQADINTVIMSDTSSGYAARVSKDAGDIDGEAIAQEAVDRALRGVNPQTVEPGLYEVILEPAGSITQRPEPKYAETVSASFETTADINLS